jgi:CBS domain-containing protein
MKEGEGVHMTKARDIMTREVITVSPDTGIVEVARILLEKRVNGLPVVDEEGRLVGIICQSDLIAQQKKAPLPSFFNLLDSFILLTPNKVEKEVQKISAIKVRDAMTKNPVSVSPEAGVEEVATLMLNKNVHTIPVVEQGKLVGVLGKEDILRTLIPDKAKQAPESA